MALEIVATVLVFLYVHLNYILSLGIMALPLPKHARPRPSRWPSVSVIIPTHNEATVIQATLRALRLSRYPGKMEIILVDSSSDGTRRVAKPHVDRIIGDAGRGKPAALNLALAKARGEVLYFLDADSRVEPNTLRDLVAALSPESPAAVGLALPHNRGNLVTRVARLYLAFLTHMQVISAHVLRSTLIAGRNFVIYKRTLVKLGGFKESLTEDLNLSLRLSRQGLKASLVATARSHEHVPHKISWYLRQQERWVAGSVYEVAKNVRGSKKRVKLLWTPSSLLLAFSPATAFVLLLFGSALASPLLLSGAGLAFLLALASSLRFLRPSDSLLSPVSFFLLSAFQFWMVVRVFLKKVLGRPFHWHKTPKE